MCRWRSQGWGLFECFLRKTNGLSGRSQSVSSNDLISEGITCDRSDFWADASRSNPCNDRTRLIGWFDRWSSAVVQEFELLCPICHPVAARQQRALTAPQVASSPRKYTVSLLPSKITEWDELWWDSVTLLSLCQNKALKILLKCVSYLKKKYKGWIIIIIFFLLFKHIQSSPFSVWVGLGLIISGKFSGQNSAWKNAFLLFDNFFCCPVIPFCDGRICRHNQVILLQHSVLDPISISRSTFAHSHSFLSLQALCWTFCVSQAMSTHIICTVFIVSVHIFI